MPKFAKANFSNTYLELGEPFHTPQAPTPVASPSIIALNPSLAGTLGIDEFTADDTLADLLAGNTIAENSQPIAAVYAGHQFGNWNPQLGDGRAILLGELQGQDGLLYDVQLKGSGRTPYSRSGDGRSPLGPVLREYIVSEAMHAMGVPTSRSLAAVSTGEQVVREFLLPGAILTRVARSHVRIGSMEYFSARGNTDAVRQLADFVIGRHYSAHIKQNFSDNPYVGLLSSVIHAQAQLIAKWMSVGFIHGVMNTDNMLLGGETIDYGPCAFMDVFEPDKVFSSIDRDGRYAYEQQPDIALWNLHWLAQTLLPLLDDEQERGIEKARELLEEFSPTYSAHYAELFAAKLGFTAASQQTTDLTERWLKLLEKEKLDFTLSFRALANELVTREDEKEPLPSLPETINSWLAEWRTALSTQGISDQHAHTTIKANNPLFTPRNHRIEEAINTAEETGDLRPFHRLLEVLESPYTFQQEHIELATPPTAKQEVLRTFCGT